MSLFQDYSSHSLQYTDERPEVAVADGVTLERRAMLRLSGTALLAALALPACASPARRSLATAAAPAAQSEELIGLGEMLAAANPLAERLVAEGMAREEAYLREVVALFARLRVPTDEEMRAVWQQIRADREAAQEFPGYMVAVMRFRLEPGKGFSHHDHRDYNGVIRGVDGEVRVRNYEVQGEEMVPPEGSTFEIRQTRDDLLLPGRFSTLGCKRDNVHELVAGPQGATVLDAFTYFAPGARSYAMDVATEPRDAERRVYEASWR